MARPKITDFSINAIMGNTIGGYGHTTTTTPDTDSEHNLQSSKNDDADHDDTPKSATGSASHKKPRPKKYQCPYCWVALSNTGQFRGHIRIHTGERPFRCDQPNCEKTFTRNEELTRHKRIHTGQRPFACRLCNKRFGRKDHLKKHTRTHERHANQMTTTTTTTTTSSSPTISTPSPDMIRSHEFIQQQPSSMSASISTPSPEIPDSPNHHHHHHHHHQPANMSIKLEASPEMMMNSLRLDQPHQPPPGVHLLADPLARPPGYWPCPTHPHTDPAALHSMLYRALATSFTNLVTENSTQQTPLDFYLHHQQQQQQQPTSDR